MATKKKAVTKSKTTGKATMEFVIEENGMLRTTIKWGKKTDERLQQAAQTASALFLREAQRCGGVLVDIGGQLIVAEPVQATLTPTQQVKALPSRW